jgi:hypothetical protein
VFLQNHGLIAGLNKLPALLHQASSGIAQAHDSQKYWELEIWECHEDHTVAKRSMTDCHMSNVSKAPLLALASRGSPQILPGFVSCFILAFCILNLQSN